MQGGREPPGEGTGLWKGFEHHYLVPVFIGFFYLPSLPSHSHPYPHLRAERKKVRGGGVDLVRLFMLIKEHQVPCSKSSLGSQDVSSFFVHNHLTTTATGASNSMESSSLSRLRRFYTISRDPRIPTVNLYSAGRA